ncbi:hypothetical protein [Nostoc sp.]
MSVKDSILTADCANSNGSWKISSLEYKQCKYGIENIEGRLECK